MTVEIVARTAESLQTYSSVSIAFEVAEVIDLEQIRLGAEAGLKTRRITAPYVKDYDRIAGNHPSDWSMRYRVETWVMLTAHDAGRQIGGAIVVADAELVPDPTAMLLWDLRVDPELRHRGIGRMLLAAAEEAVRSRGVGTLYVETQDVNVGACRFYARAASRSTASQGAPIRNFRTRLDSRG